MGRVLVYSLVDVLNNGFVNLKLLKRLFGTENGLGDKLATLNMRMQNMFVAWKPYQTEIFENRYIDPFDIRFIRAFQLGLEKVHETDQLLEAQLNKNLGILEQMATLYFPLGEFASKRHSGGYGNQPIHI